MALEGEQKFAFLLANFRAAAFACTFGLPRDAVASNARLATTDGTTIAFDQSAKTREDWSNRFESDLAKFVSGQGCRNSKELKTRAIP